MSSTIRTLTVFAVAAAAAAPVVLAQEVSPDDRDLLWSRSKPPNVLMILDSGATMANDPETNSINYIANADDESSKLYQAKEVMQDFVLTFPEFNMGFTYYQKSNIEVHYTNFLYQVQAGQPDMLDGTAPGDEIRMGGTADFNHSHDAPPLWPIRYGPDGSNAYFFSSRRNSRFRRST